MMGIRVFKMDMMPSYVTKYAAETIRQINLFYGAIKHFFKKPIMSSKKSLFGKLLFSAKFLKLS